MPNEKWSKEQYAKDRYSEVIEASYARLAKINTIYIEGKKEIYSRMVEKILESRFDSNIVKSEENEAAKKIKLLWIKCKSMIEWEKNRRKELEKIYW